MKAISIRLKWSVVVVSLHEILHFNCNSNSISLNLKLKWSTIGDWLKMRACVHIDTINEFNQSTYKICTYMLVMILLVKSLIKY